MKSIAADWTAGLSWMKSTAADQTAGLSWMKSTAADQTVGVYWYTINNGRSECWSLLVYNQQRWIGLTKFFE